MSSRTSTEDGLAALRNEILAAMQGEQSTLTFGAAAFGIVAAAGFHASQVATTFTLVAIAPGWRSSSLSLGETVRMFRAGQHIARLEELIKTAYGPSLPDGVFCWECELRKERGAEAIILRPTVAVVVGFACVSIVSGAINGLRGHSHALHVAVLVALPIALVVVLVSGGWVIRRAEREAPGSMRRPRGHAPDTVQ